MKISKLLNKKYFLIIISLLIGLNSFADEKPVDIWNIEKKKVEDENINSISSESERIIKNNNKSSIYNMQSQKQTDLIKLEENLSKEEIKIIGLYDPEDYGLNLNMWTNSDGDQLRTIFSKIDKIKLSRDAAEILNISLLTNAYQPDKNMTEKEFLKIKSDWLIKNSDLKLIEEYLIKNQIFNLHPELSKFLLDEYLSNFDLKKSCEILSKNLKPINDDYLTKFQIYCLIDSGKKEEAQVIFDLKKELGFKNKYFENKINYLFGYISTTSKEISEKSILDFHLAHKTNTDFSFEPTNTTDRIIWKYLSSANLLNSFKEIEISELEKISTIEKAVHNKNYPEKDLFELYKRFQFNINQLLNAEKSYKLLSNIESRALIYQKILLESEVVEKLKLLKILKNLFLNDDIGDAFDVKLKEFLNVIEPTDVPDNLTSS